jgi:hypothetical protein
MSWQGTSAHFCMSPKAVLSVLCFVTYLNDLHMNLTQCPQNFPAGCLNV